MDVFSLRDRVVSAYEQFATTFTKNLAADRGWVERIYADTRCWPGPTRPGVVYRTRLDPPPADARVAYPARAKERGCRARSSKSSRRAPTSRRRSRTVATVAGGELPASFFGSYSAFANTDGGVVLLGVREREDGALEVAGVDDVARLQKQLWDGLDNKQRVSTNVLGAKSVRVIDLDGRKVVRVEVPRASRQQRPVYAGANPLTGTYRRGHEGDCRADESTVRRMLAEQLEDSRDGRVLAHFALSEIDAGTLARYRKRYLLRSPEHPWNELDDRDFSARAVDGDGTESRGRRA